MAKEVVIVGVGALGSHVALFARNWDVQLTLVDFDKIEQKNTQSQFHTKMGLGRNKAQALAQTLQGLFGIHVKVIPHKLAEGNVTQLLGNASLILDCTDNIAARSLIQAFAKTSGTPCLHGAVTADGTFGSVLWTEDFVPDPEKPGQVTCEDGEHLPFLALVASRMAVTAQAFLSRGERRGFEVALSGIKRVT